LFNIIYFLKFSPVFKIPRLDGTVTATNLARIWNDSSIGRFDRST